MQAHVDSGCNARGRHDRAFIDATNTLLHVNARELADYANCMGLK